LTIGIVMLFHAHDVYINAVTAFACCWLILACIAHCSLGDKQTTIKLTPWVLLTLLCSSTCSVNQAHVHAPNHLQELHDNSAVLLAVALQSQQQPLQH